jgi:tetratricopeptide (TPR) repeat protein
MLYYSEKRYAEAEQLYRRSLAIWESAMGPNNPDLATTLDNLAVALVSQDKYAEAEQLYRRSLALRQSVTTASLNNLAMALEGRGQDAAAERYYKQAVAMGEKLPDTAMLAFTLHNYAGLLHKMGRDAESKRAEARAKALEK